MSVDAGPDERATDSSQADSGTDRLLNCENVSVSYGKVAALRDVSLHVQPGEIVGVIGPNGAGKTTLSDTIAGFLDYDGSVTYRDREVADSSVASLVKDGLVYCTESRDLFDFMDVEDNLRLGGYQRSSDVIEDRLEFVYDLFPRLAERSDQEAHTMSGGEQQMLAVGRALMGDPDFLLLDEPTLGLAPIIIDDISAGLERLREEGITMLLCEQNVTFTFKHADRVYLLENGEVVTHDAPENLRGDDYIQDTYLGH